MSSQRRRSSSRRRRFGFSGNSERTHDNVEPVGVDEILESMSRQTKFGSRLEEEDDFALESKAASTQDPLVPMGASFDQPRRDWGKFAFPLMLLGGIIIVLLAGASRLPLNTSAISTATQNPALGSIFTDPVKLLLLALLCFIPALAISRRRRRGTEQLLLNS